MTSKKPSIFCALDTTDTDRALSLAGMMARAGCGIKLGLEYFNASGPHGIRTITEKYPDLPLFLDLKFHDIPNTVAGAVRAVTPLRPAYLNVHASGGVDMMAATREAAEDTAAREGITTPLLLAVTILTSLDEKSIEEIGYLSPVEERVIQMAQLAQKSGMDGIVCSSKEISAVRSACGEGFTLMVPGIRPAGSAQGDQKRVMGPQEALSTGAHHLVIGRPITQAENPEEAALSILRSLKNTQNAA